jgi:hypothetical protein
VPLTYRPRPGTAPIETLIARFAAPYRCPLNEAGPAGSIRRCRWIQAKLA